MRGKLVAIVGPSGSGKGTLMKRARSVYPDILFPVSCTTRDPRPGEVDGTDYHFLTAAEFDRRIESSEFIEWAQFGAHKYGTEKKEILPHLEMGELVMREFEVQGTRLLRDLLPPDEFVTIYIDAGSWEGMARRVRDRAPITDEELEKRRLRYLDERTFKDEATYVVQNPDGGQEQADRDFMDVVRALRAEIGLPV
ncbi:MAG: guanylate kinase [Parcubacteria bacterium C7867-004]|nr:MAG: guanylate kinase [Parcubacteria bacterium C7867-004]